jgi:hypothetical protein
MPFLHAISPILRLQSAGRLLRRDSWASPAHDGTIVGPIAVVEKDHTIEWDACRFAQPLEMGRFVGRKRRTAPYLAVAREALREAAREKLRNRKPWQDFEHSQAPFRAPHGQRSIRTARHGEPHARVLSSRALLEREKRARKE